MHGGSDAGSLRHSVPGLFTTAGAEYRVRGLPTQLTLVLVAPDGYLYWLTFICSDSDELRLIRQLLGLWASMSTDGAQQWQSVRCKYTTEDGIVELNQGTERQVDAGLWPIISQRRSTGACLPVVLQGKT